MKTNSTHAEHVSAVDKRSQLFLCGPTLSPAIRSRVMDYCIRRYGSNLWTPR
ncbi:hypothetical protein J6590_039817 [Homalodisca vitripennis]|nr:hypothetical protein J6590_039817 [Homalodisca vitripennis]